MMRIRAWLSVAAIAVPLLPGAIGVTAAVARTAPKAPHWTLTTPAPPPPAVNAPMVYDEARKQIMMFDSDGGSQSAVWIWTGKTWRKAWTYNGDATKPNGPSPRSNPAILYDPMSKKVLLFGGVFVGNTNDETWLWDGAHWSQPESTTSATATKPPARSNAAIVYDVAKQKAIMFGGTKSATTVLDDTWVWNGAQGAAGWTQLPKPTSADPAPAGRFNSGFVYDASRRQVVMFGGTGVNDLPVADANTWVLNPTATAWTVGAPAGDLKPRVDAAMAYDPWSTRTILVGGATYPSTTPVYNGDTWAWNGHTWTLVDNNLERRVGSTLAAHNRCRCLVIVGGQRSTLGGSGLGESLMLLGSRWRVIARHPSPRRSAPAVYDAATGQLVVFGGDPTWSGSLGDTWLWTGRGGWTESTTNGPQALAWIAADPGRGTLVYFNSAQTWTWDGKRWTHVTDSGPPSGYPAPVLAYDSARSVLLVFYNPDNPKPGDPANTMLWNGHRWTQATGPEPSARIGAQIAYDAARKQLVLFGGTGCPTTGVLGTGTGPTTANGTDYCTDTWTWNGRRWSKVATTGPAGRTDAVLTYSPADRAILLFGGNGAYRVGDQPFAPSYNPLSSTKFLGDTWLFDGHRWIDKTSTSAPPRAWAAFGYDPNSRRLMMFGGEGDPSVAGTTPQLPSTLSSLQTFQGDTRLWDRTTWTQPSALHSVPARTGALLLYDRAIGKTVLIGGSCVVQQPYYMGYGPDTPHTVPCDDVWGWDGHNWTQVDRTKPAYCMPVYVERAGRIACRATDGLWTWGR